MSGKRKSGIRRVGRGLVAGAMVAFVTGVLPWSPVPTASAAAVNLEITPEVSSVTVGQTITLTASLRDPNNTEIAAAAPTSVHFELNGSPLDTDGNTPTTPDRSCEIPTGQKTCQLVLTTNQSGDGVVAGWINNSPQAGVTELDTGEGRVSNPLTDCAPAGTPFQPDQNCPPPGQQGVTERDTTDLVSVAWTAGPARLDCDGKQSGVDQQPAKPGTSAVVRCKLTDAFGTPEEGERIDAENFGGANDPDEVPGTGGAKPDYDTTPGNPETQSPPNAFCTTGEDGTCEATIAQSKNQLGPADICFWWDGAGDNVFNLNGAATDGGDCEEAVGETENNDVTDKVTVAWEDPDPAKGGVDGQVESAAKDPGQQHSITATVFSQFGEKFAGNTTVKFEFFSGSPNDADGNTPNTPDRTCSTAGKDNCTITYSQADPGTDLVCVFTNATPAMAGDSKNGTCDGEGLLDASANDGAPSPPNDDQDVVRRIWNGGVEDQGYWMVASDGGIFSFGNGAKFHGSTGDIALAKPIVGMAALFTGTGYWLVASDGGVFSFGDAKFHGSTGDITLAQPIVGMAPTPSGNGYWLVASDGGIFAFGDAKFHGSTGNIQLAQPVVGMAATPTGNGYWLVAKDGGIFSFGDAEFHGSTGDIQLVQPVVGMAATPSGNGYWFVAADGGIFSFGDAEFHGSTGDIQLAQPVVGMAVTPSGNGYWFTASDGGIFSFGDAGFFGSTGNIVLAQPVVGMAAAPAQ